MPMEHSMEARALKTGYDNRVIIDDVNVEIPMERFLSFSDRMDVENQRC